MIKLTSKSPNDDNDYYTYTLSNKLNVILINDKNVNMTCVSMLVKIGNLYDTVEGIAHFLEHMLFNGTEKYKNEAEFGEFITTNGGFTNAYTTLNHTCYYYTIQSTELTKSLDMFSDFFVSPLLNEDSIKREKEAVHAEHIKNKREDIWRTMEVLKTAFKPNHPARKFGTGSNDTLNYTDIHLKVKDFYKKHYSSDLMTLFVLTNNDINIVKNQIDELFSKVPLIVTPENRRIITGDVLMNGKIITMVPIKNDDQLKLYWELPFYRSNKSNSPNNFISYILGHESSGTIYDKLTKKGYITCLVSGLENVIYDHCLFFISIKLTDLGKQYFGEIISIICSYIELMKDRRNYDHLKSLYIEYVNERLFQFKYLKKRNCIDAVLELSSLIAMNDFPIEELLVVDHKFDTFENIINNFYNVLMTLSINNSVIVWRSKLFDGKTTKIEKHYGVEYNINDLTDEYIKNINIQLNYEDLTLPPVNPYLSIGENMLNLDYVKPIALKNENGIRAFWLPTNKFKTPDVCVNVAIDIPYSLLDKRENMKTQLFVSSLLKSINNDIYLCENANYSININVTNGKLYIIVFGNYDKIHTVCEFIVNSFFDKTIIKRNIFENVCMKQKEDDNNVMHNSPYMLVPIEFNKIMCQKFYSYKDRLEVIDLIEYDHVILTMNELMKNTAMKILISGNCDENIANKLINTFSKFVSMNVYNPDDVMIDLYGTPTESNDKYVWSNDNKHDENSAVNVMVFIDKIRYGKSIDWNKTICLMEVLEKIIGPKYFDALRTQEKYGYIVKYYVKNMGDPKCFSKYGIYLVQSPRKTSDDMIQRTYEFIDQTTACIYEISNDEFNNIKNACKSILLEPFKNLFEMSSYIFHTQVETEYMSFDLIQKLADTYDLLTLDELKTFYMNKFVNKSRRILSIGLNGCSTTIATI